MNEFESALILVKEGKFLEAKQAFEEVLLENPKNCSALYNLGMCFTELGEPEKAIVTLERCIQLKPDFSNAHVALGYAHSKLGHSEDAEKYFLEALKIAPGNSFALRNLGALLGKSGDIEKSVQYLEKAYQIDPSDSATVYGLGYAYQRARDFVKADKLYRDLLAMDAPASLKNPAKDGLREIASIQLKSKGLRMDAVMYMVTALQMFQKEDENKVKAVAFEIALKGQFGLSVNNPDKKYTLHNLPGEFTGLQLVSYMYVAFKRIAPEQNIGVDLSKEYEMALGLFEGEKPS